MSIRLEGFQWSEAISLPVLLPSELGVNGSNDGPVVTKTPASPTTNTIDEGRGETTSPAATLARSQQQRWRKQVGRGWRLWGSSKSARGRAKETLVNLDVALKPVDPEGMGVLHVKAEVSFSLGGLRQVSRTVCGRR